MTSETKRFYQNCKARIGISMQNRLYDTGIRKKYIQYLIFQGFDQIEIQIADTLHRHNLIWQNNIDEATAYKLSISLGDIWCNTIADDILILDRYPISVWRWNDYLAHPNIRQHISLVNKFYKQDEGFRKAVECDVRAFLARKKAECNDCAYRHSINYILEEIAVMSLTNNLFPAVESYAGKELTCQRYMAEHCKNWNPKQPYVYEYINLKVALN